MQRAAELRGIATVSPSVARDVTEHAKPPRAVFLPFMMGHLFGVPFHKQLQRQVLMEMIDLLETAEESGTIRDLDLSWASARKEGKALEKALGLKP